MKYLSQVEDIFGTVEPPKGMDIGGGGDPISGLGQLVGWGINMFIIGAGLFMIFYLFMGAFDWINSGGEKEKITKAQQKITNAIIGMVLVFGVIIIFNLVAGQLLGVIENTPDGFRLKIPTL
jgi:amino acid transporter